MVPEPTPAPVLPGFPGEALSVAPLHSAMGVIPAFRGACRSIRHQIQAVASRLNPLPAMHPSPALDSMPESAKLTRVETPPPAGTLVAPGIPGGNSPATPVFAGIVRDKFPGNPSIGQHNPDALCNHAHRQTPDARHADSHPGDPAIPPPAHCVGDPATGSTEDPSSTVPFVSGRGLPSCTQHRLVCILRRAAVDPIALPAAPQITFEPSAEVSAVPTCGSPEAGMIVPAVSPPENAPNELGHRPRNRPNFMRFGGCSSLQTAVSHADWGGVDQPNRRIHISNGAGDDHCSNKSLPRHAMDWR